MARRISVEITGDASSLERSFKRAGHSASTFNRDVSKSVRGAAAGSGIFRGLGRSLAFASGGFLAFASAGEAIRKSIDAATEAAATQRQLAAQFKANRQNLSTYRQQIEEATLSTSKLSGFTRDDLTKSFITAYRGSKSVSVGLKIQAIAADVARGRHIGLAQSALALTKAYGGQSTALRRLGVLVPKNLSGMKALEFVARRFAGQAKAGTTAQERFSAALQTTEETVGGALLPSLTKYLNRATAWLDQSKNQQKIQNDVNEAVRIGTGVASAFTNVLKTVTPPLKDAIDALGGAKKATEDLFAVWAASKVAKVVAGERAIAAGAALMQGGAAAGSFRGRKGGMLAADILGSQFGPGGAKMKTPAFGYGLSGGAQASRFGKLGTAAGTAAGSVALLRSSLLRLGAIGVIAVGIDLIISKKDRDKAIDFLKGSPGSQQNKSLHDLIHVGQGIADAATQIVKGNPFHSGHTLGYNQQGKRTGPGPLGRDAAAATGHIGQTTDPYAHRRQLAEAQRLQTATGQQSTKLGFKNRFAQQELSLAQAQLTTQQADDRKVLVAEAQSIRERIKRIHGHQKHLAEETQLTQQLAGIQGQITQIDQQSLQSTTRWRRLELALAQAQLTQTQSDDKKILQAEAATIRGRLASLAKTGKTLDERTALTQQLVGIEGQIQSIDQQALDKRKAAIAKHLAAVKQKEQQLKQQISQITQQFSQALDTARSALGELFKGPVLAPTEAQSKAQLGFKGPDVKTLTQDLNAQVAQFQRFQHDLAILAKRGASKQLLKELRAKGTEALPEIEALAKAKKGDLKAFFKAFGKGEKLVQQVAKIDMKAQLVTLRADNLQLQQLRGHGKARRMAQGGIVRSPTFAMVGESGPEAVIPLSKMRGGGREQVTVVPVYLDGQVITKVVSKRQKRNTELGVSQVRGRHGGRNAMGPV